MSLLKWIIRNGRLALCLAPCFSLLWSACTPATEEADYSPGELAFTFEGPLFSGPNTAQVTFSPELDEMLTSKSLTREDIEHVWLQQAEISADSGFRNISSFVLQFTAENARMTEAAVLNPVTPPSPAVLTPSQQADLAEIFRQPSVTAVLDAGINEDADTSYAVKANFTFRILLRKR